MKIKLSKSQWKMIGRKTGWMKKAHKIAEDWIFDEEFSDPAVRAMEVEEIKSLINSLKQELKMSWVKPGYDFEGDDSCILWSGEKAYITTKDGKKMPAFDHYTMEYDIEEREYNSGVHKDLVEWSNKHDIRWEAHDAGTYLGYRGAIIK
jgi:hypothetical protein